METTAAVRFFSDCCSNLSVPDGAGLSLPTAAVMCLSQPSVSFGAEKDEVMLLRLTLKLRVCAVWGQNGHPTHHPRVRALM